MEEILRCLEKTFEDKVFSKSEKKAVKAIIEEKQFNKSEQDLLRSKIFDLAKYSVSDYKDSDLIEWLETANKLILPKAEQDTSTFNSFFSPGNDCLNAILRNIRNASNTMEICVFTISDDRISKQLIDAHKQGKKIRIISDDDKTYDLGSDVNRLKETGIEVQIDRSPNHMHHKFAIFDHQILLTGSYNWTRSAADRNQENLIETNQSEAIKPFLKEFNRLWETTFKL